MSKWAIENQIIFPEGTIGIDNDKYYYRDVENTPATIERNEDLGWSILLWHGSSIGGYEGIIMKKKNLL